MPDTVGRVPRAREPSRNGAAHGLARPRPGCSRLPRLAIWLQLSAGHGPPECTWVVARLVDALLAAAAETGVTAACLERVPGSEASTLRSALIELSEGPCEHFAAGWQGSALWVGRSPFRPEHRRRNWFVQVTRIEPPGDDEVASLRPEDLEVTTMRSTGAGGQNVNKRSTAVRVRHLPSGAEVVARSERSQAANRREGLARLAWLLREQAQGRRDAGLRAQWDAKGQVERGSPRQVFRGPDFIRDAPT
ncbi:MAG: peptide chain release factor H [Nannocystis sp.]|nr:peptide chain release factor H [Nannocystis sp.]MBA3544918.1 peptide chain release factor H [Nannocystis sp.]